MNFGFTINQPRSINLDRNDLSISRKLLEELPELDRLWQLYSHLYSGKSDIVQSSQGTNPRTTWRI